MQRNRTAQATHVYNFRQHWCPVLQAWCLISKNFEHSPNAAGVPTAQVRVTQTTHQHLLSTRTPEGMLQYHLQDVHLLLKARTRLEGAHASTSLGTSAPVAASTSGGRPAMRTCSSSAVRCSFLPLTCMVYGGAGLALH